MNVGLGAPEDVVKHSNGTTSPAPMRGHLAASAWQVCGAVLMALGMLTFTHAQDYPAAKTIRILTSQPGSGSDIIGRIVAERLPAGFGQRAIIDNRGILAPEIAAKAPPDGYTVLFYSTPLWVSPLMRDNVAWDPLRDFAPVTLAVNAPNLLIVHPSLPVKSVRELIALAKARPGELNYG
jgi:tripartite-type tricarboxylate transporter receptor subunit TctC